MQGGCFIGFLIGLATTGIVTLHLKASRNSLQAVQNTADVADVATVYTNLLAEVYEAQQHPPQRSPGHVTLVQAAEISDAKIVISGVPSFQPTSSIVLVAPVTTSPVPTHPPRHEFPMGPDEIASSSAHAHALLATAALPPHIVRQIS